ncbi:GT4 family glycosyltransferase PelF [Marinobacter sp. AL4B]|uniref:GT4 family glycosyltransferase PelF n=1 Tax=Marinobacter sp. AL4B TaxID=2871173 RepID=UPI001CAA57A5|nr:GT4 family glycosyltransferase PelF [Marinobacter sp. AL4B]MBZ0335566.1 GT4 family glycosyltransferase PelF [Marinobacter sp. AL4B]
MIWRKPAAPETSIADITLLLEGTYPFVRGGVSSWVHQIISGLPQYRFSLIFLGGDRSHYGEQQYQLPENVIHLECHYLMDPLVESKPKARKGNRAAFDTQRKLHSQLRNKAPVPKGVFSDIFQSLGRKGGISKEDFLHSEESWKVIDESYNKYCTDPSFIDYFWTIKIMHGPLFRIAEIARNIPPTRAVHAVSTGYAGLMGAMLKETRGIPYILTEHGIYTKERKIDLSQADWIKDVTDKVSTNLNDDLGYIRKLWIRFFESLGRMSYQMADPIISLYIGNQQRQLADGAEPALTQIVPNGIDPSRFEGALAARPDEVPMVMGLVGRVVPIKDIKTFIRAMRAVYEVIPNVEGWIVGPEEEDPVYVKECRELVSSLGLENCVKFLGFQNVNDILPKLGLMVLTSISEALPLVILEANAAGLPCLATDVGACRELIEGGTVKDRRLGSSGAVVPIADPEATARAATRLLLDKQRWQTASAAGLARVKQFYTLESMYDSYRNIYDTALSAENRED